MKSLKKSSMSISQRGHGDMNWQIHLMVHMKLQAIHFREETLNLSTTMTT